jgi:hypothetical protein
MILKLVRNVRKASIGLLRIPMVLAVLCAFVGNAHAIPINAVDISGGTGVITGADVVAGWLFRAEDNIDVISLGMWDNGEDGFTADVEVGLWTEGGAFLTSTTVTSLDPLTNGFRFATLDDSVSLISGSNYVIGGLLQQPDIFRTLATVTNSSGVTWLDSRGKTTSTLDFPDEEGDVAGSYFGANFQYESVPAPATLALFGIGLLGLSWSRRIKS